MYDKMSFKWDKFFDVGICMKNISEKEEYQRSAVGRYYYAAYGLIREYYEKKYNKVVPSINSHSFLINELESSYGDERRIGKNLRSMRSYRNFADYNKIFHSCNVERTEQIYNEIIRLLENLNKKSK